jgi:dolichol-phosphate mannosyltransferase
MSEPSKIAVIIPCYKVTKKIEAVLKNIGPEVSRIYCINDGCPNGTGILLEELALKNQRLVVLHHEHNRGVGAATVSGYQAAIADDMNILVKIDGDGQMDPSFIPYFIQPIIDGDADYVKGNRFFKLASLVSMPKTRILGNAILTFMTKLSTGYWNLFDPTNGYTALHSGVACELEMNSLSERYFFESDILFRLSIVRANIIELPMDSYYDDEESHLSELNAALTFPFMHSWNFLKRLTYCYFLRNFSIASLSLILGLALMLFGFIFGLDSWITAVKSGIPATSGTVMLAALPFMLGLQMLFNFLNYDIANTPQTPIHKRLHLIRTLNHRVSEKL